MRRPRIGISQRPRRAGSVWFPVTAADQDASCRSARRLRQSAAVLLFAAIVRGLTLWAFPAGLEQDVDGYRQLAENLRQTGVYGLRDTSTPATVVRPTAFRPPLYPLMLTALVARTASLRGPSQSHTGASDWQPSVAYSRCAPLAVRFVVSTARGARSLGPNPP